MNVAASSRRAALTVLAALLCVILGAAPKAHADSGNETLNVTVPTTTTVPDNGSGQSAGGGGPSGLAWTGLEVLGSLVMAGGLVAVGGTLLTVGRRRSRHG